jgi:hypothetical protein
MRLPLRVMGQVSILGVQLDTQQLGSLAVGETNGCDGQIFLWYHEFLTSWQFSGIVRI